MDKKPTLKIKNIYNIMQGFGVLVSCSILVKYVPMEPKNIPFILLFIFGVPVAMVGAWLEGYFDE
jgi:hypothetical protein